MVKVHYFFPRKWNTLLPTRPMLLDRKDDRLKNTTMKNSYRLLFDEIFVCLYIIWVVFVIEVIFPLNKSLIRY